MLALLAVETAVIVTLVWTNALHNVVWQSEAVDRAGVITVLSYEARVLPLLHNVYSYPLVVAGLWLFAKSFKRAHQIYVHQALSVLVAVVAPASANLLVVLGVWPSSFDPTPAAVAVGGVTLMWGLFRRRLFDVIPVAREAVIGGMPDGILVLDQRNRIVDVDAAASAIVGRSPGWLVGREEAEALAALRARQAAAESGHDDADGGVITATVNGEEHSFELRSQTLSSERGGLSGRLLLIHDVTEKRAAERALRDGMRRLDQMVAERTAERERTEGALAAERERLAVTIRSMGEGVIVLDPRGAHRADHRSGGDARRAYRGRGGGHPPLVDASGIGR